MTTTAELNAVLEKCKVSVDGPPLACADNVRILLSMAKKKIEKGEFTTAIRCLAIVKAVNDNQ
jgi:hypothetical protein